MARARNIKPGLFRNEVLGVADPYYTLLFEGLWVIADREGRLEDRPLRIKADVFPYREGVNVEPMLAWLATNGFILRYVAGGKALIQILEFAKHQSPHRDEKKSELPAPDLQATCTVQVQEITGDCTPDSLIPDSFNLIADSNISQPAPKKPAQAEDTDFLEAYAAYPRRPGASKASALKAWRARIASGVDGKAMIAGVKRYAAFTLASGTEPNFIKMPATFFGPDCHFESDWTPPERRAQLPAQPAARASPAPSRHSNFENIDYREGIEDGRIT